MGNPGTDWLELEVTLRLNVPCTVSNEMDCAEEGEARWEVDILNDGGLPVNWALQQTAGLVLGIRTLKSSPQSASPAEARNT